LGALCCLGLSGRRDPLGFFLLLVGRADDHLTLGTGLADVPHGLTQRVPRACDPAIGRRSPFDGLVDLRTFGAHGLHPRERAVRNVSTSASSGGDFTWFWTTVFRPNDASSWSGSSGFGIR
jgi:hypothetical protein